MKVTVIGNLNEERFRGAKVSSYILALLIMFARQHTNTTKVEPAARLCCIGNVTMDRQGDYYRMCKRRKKDEKATMCHENLQ